MSEQLEAQIQNLVMEIQSLNSNLYNLYYQLSNSQQSYLIERIANDVSNMNCNLSNLDNKVK